MKSSAPAVAATADFVAVHLADTAQDRRLIDSFSAGKNAKGLEIYLKNCALADETANESRTYLVKDSVTGELACYFSLRACLIPLPLEAGLFTTVPAVELANFAVNDNYRPTQRSAKGIGAYVFLEFILPFALRSASFVAAKWLCIYALPEPKLLDYYHKNLGFSRLPPEKESFVYGHVKPKYDQGCIFMYQPL